MRKNNRNSGAATPLLMAGDDGWSGRTENNEQKWLEKVVDMKEAKEQILFSLPMILINICYYLIPLVSVMFAGHLGQLQLAGANLANSWATVTGFAFMVRLFSLLFFLLCFYNFPFNFLFLLGNTILYFY